MVLLGSFSHLRLIIGAAVGLILSGCSDHVYGRPNGSIALTTEVTSPERLILEDDNVMNSFDSMTNHTSLKVPEDMLGTSLDFLVNQTSLKVPEDVLGASLDFFANQTSLEVPKDVLHEAHDSTTNKTLQELLEYDDKSDESLGLATSETLLEVPEFEDVSEEGLEITEDWEDISGPENLEENSLTDEIIEFSPTEFELKDYPSDEKINYRDYVPPFLPLSTSPESRLEDEITASVRQILEETLIREDSYKENSYGLGYEKYYPYAHSPIHFQSVYDNVLEFNEIKIAFNKEMKEFHGEVDQVFTRLTELIEGKITKLVEDKNATKEMIISEGRNRTEEVRKFQEDLLTAQHILSSGLDAVNNDIEGMEVAVHLEKDKQDKKLRDSKEKAIKDKDMGENMFGQIFGLIKTIAKLPTFFGTPGALIDFGLELPKMVMTIQDLVNAIKGAVSGSAEDKIEFSMENNITHLAKLKEGIFNFKNTERIKRNTEL